MNRKQETRKEGGEGGREGGDRLGKPLCRKGFSVHPWTGSDYMVGFALYPEQFNT